MATRKVTGLVNAPVGHDGIDAKQINPRSGLHRNVWVSDNLDLSAVGVSYGPVFLNNDVEIQKVLLVVTEIFHASTDAEIFVGTAADADRFGEVTIVATTGNVLPAAGAAVGNVIDITAFCLTGTGEFSLLPAGTALRVACDDGADQAGQCKVVVEYVILDDVA